jgi:hypothetical protein
MLPRNGKALSQPHDAWPVFALDAYLLRCRDKAYWQKAMVVSSSFMLFGMILGLVFSAIGGNPEGVRAEWRKFELQCLPQPPDQGAS